MVLFDLRGSSENDNHKADPLTAYAADDLALIVLE
jgi:hypothetical protein